MRPDSPKPYSRVTIDFIREMDSRILNPEEIQALLEQYPADKRLLTALLQKAEFPQHQALSVMNRLYSVELLRIAQGPRTTPFVRQKAEMAFNERFRQMQKGEQISILKQMGPNLLRQFSNLTDSQLLAAMLNNPRCTEELVVDMLRKKGPGSGVYQAVMQSRWINNLSVAEMLARDPQTPIRALLMVIPILPLGIVRQLYRSPQLHTIVRAAVEKRLKGR